MQKEIAENNIRVNAVSPGTINTPGVKEYFKAEPKKLKMLEKSSLLQLVKQKLVNWLHFFLWMILHLLLDKLSQLMEALRLIKLMYKNKYSYPELIRVEKNNVRYYRDTKENLVPSVTTILSATGDKSGIDAWKRRVGNKAAQAVVDEATTIGTAVHLAIENYLYGKQWEQFTDDKMGLMSKQIARDLSMTVSMILMKSGVWNLV